MIKLRTVAALATCVVAAGAVTGTALAAGADDPTPNPSRSAGPFTADRRTDGNPSPDDSPSTADSPSPEVSAAGPSAAPSSSVSTVDAADARAIALRTTNGGRVVRIEREAEHGRPVWDVRVLVGGVEHDLDIDRESGAVLRHEVERTSGRDGRASDDDRDDDRGGHGADDRDDDRGGHGGDDRDDDRGGRR
ncbi:PepSY domain-containing protein [Micromonospora sp. NPDC049559]|uniref:PepSY domain-containing protein n=1 Tax=Micromonospora sp. NPDC049559 TaxID=3155923 RepID=UPI0034492DE3